MVHWQEIPLSCATIEATRLPKIARTSSQPSIRWIVKVEWSNCCERRRRVVEVQTSLSSTSHKPQHIDQSSVRMSRQIPHL